MRAHNQCLPRRPRRLCGLAETFADDGPAVASPAVARHGRLLAGVCVSALVAAAFLPAQRSVAQSQADDSQAEEDSVEEIVVTGSRIGRTDFEAVPLQVIGRDDIANQGVPTITDIVKNMTINTGSNFNADFSTQRQTAGTSQVNFRGLTIGSTLTLVNGRRVTKTSTANQDGATFVDINQFPLLMLERVEALKEGGSAIYGSDAVGGVFNIITRKGFEGFELEVSGQTTTEDSQEDLRLSFAVGAAGERAEAAFYFDYFKRTNLRGIERDFFPQFPESNFNTSGLGHVPTLIFSEPATEGPFAGKGLTGFVLDPDCGVQNSIPGPFQAGADPAQGAAGFCRADFGPAFDMVFKEERFLGFAEGSYKVADNLEAFGEISFAFNEADSTQALASPILSRTVVIPEDHPANPHGVDVGFRGRIAEPTRAERPTSNEYFRVVGGINYNISDNWDFEISGVQSEHRFDISSPATNLNELTRPGNEPGVLLFRDDFNPFGSRFTEEGPQNNPEVLEAILGSVRNIARSELTTGEIGFAGDFGKALVLPGGRIGVAFGAQIRRDFLHIDNDDAINRGVLGFEGQAGDTPPTTRNTYAGYGEVSLPVFDNLDIQAAIRHEAFEGISDSTTDPKVSIHYRPFEEILLRASFATALRAPTLFQTDVTSQTALPLAFDPFMGSPGSMCDLNNPIFAFPAAQTSGNSDLTPEDADTWFAGVVFTSQKSNLRFSADYWRFEIDEVIVKETVQDIINQDCLDDGIANDPRITRGPQGLIRSVNNAFINAASLNTDGVDINASYAIDSARIGSFDFQFAATWLREYDFQLAPGRPVIKGDGSRNFINPFSAAPKWRTNLTTDWTSSDEVHGATAILRFISGFDDDNDPNPDARLGGHVTLDLQYRLAVDRLLGYSNSGTNLSIGSINITDNDPPQAVGVFGFETTVHDPRGRLVYLRISQTF